MFNNVDIFNITLNNGMEWVLGNVSMNDIEDPKFNAMIKEYLNLRKSMINYLLNSLPKEKPNNQITYLIENWLRKKKKDKK